MHTSMHFVARDDFILAFWIHRLSYNSKKNRTAIFDLSHSLFVFIFLFLSLTSPRLFFPPFPFLLHGKTPDKHAGVALHTFHLYFSS